MPHPTYNRFISAYMTSNYYVISYFFVVESSDTGLLESFLNDPLGTILQNPEAAAAAAVVTAPLAVAALSPPPLPMFPPQGVPQPGGPVSGGVGALPMAVIGVRNIHKIVTKIVIITCYYAIVKTDTKNICTPFFRTQLSVLK